MERKPLIIEELESVLIGAERTKWTPEIDEVLREYYPKFAAVRKVKDLRDYINAKYDRDFDSNAAFAKRYEMIR